MTCPDNLLIGYRRGALSDEERARLHAHLSGCPSCRLTLRVGGDFDQVLQTAPGDDVIAARFAQALSGKLAKQGAPQRAGRPRVAWVAAVAIAMLGSAGLAAARFGLLPFFGPSAPAQAPSEAIEPQAPARAPAPKQVLAKPEPPAEEPSSEDPTSQDEAAKTRAPGAPELFAQANALRRGGELGRARTLYQKLQQLHPRSDEATVSHVSFGRVLLELGQAREALAQFERYRAKLPRGPLAEEALFGQGSALEQLGRRGDERRTWESLLAVYPGSVYAERARQRLAQLP